MKPGATAEGEVAVSKTAHAVYHVSDSQLYSMGVALILGGQFINWNHGLTMGFWEFFIAMVVVATGYICLTLCLAEMASMLPFAGGSYGYVRCSLGPFAGYMVGCCEALAYTLYVAAAVSSIGTLITDLIPQTENAQPAQWLMVYGVVLTFQLRGAGALWTFIGVCSTLALAIILLFVLPNIVTADVWRYPENHHLGTLHFVEFYHHLPLAAWFFKGIEPMTLTCNSVSEGAAVRVPRAMLYVIATMVTTAFSIVLIACSNEPGPRGLLEEMHPLDQGILRAYGLSMQQGTPFMIPATMASVYAFQYASSQQLRSMAGSGLLPPALRGTFGRYGTPWVALATGAVTSYAVLLLCYFVVPDDEGPNVDEVADWLFSISMLCMCTVNVSLLVAYWVLHERFGALGRGFHNPLGRGACVTAGAVFTFMAGSLAFVHKDNFVTLAAFVGMLGLFWGYYEKVARKRQFFSQEEQEKFFKAYVLNANQKKKKRVQSRLRTGGSAPGVMRSTAGLFVNTASQMLAGRSSVRPAEEVSGK